MLTQICWYLKKKEKKKIELYTTRKVQKSDLSLSPTNFDLSKLDWVYHIPCTYGREPWAGLRDFFLIHDYGKTTIPPHSMTLLLLLLFDSAGSMHSVVRVRVWYPVYVTSIRRVDVEGRRKDLRTESTLRV